MTTVAILTADRAAGERLRHGLQSIEPALLLRLVRDEPDVSFRSLRISDIVICGYDVSRERMTRLLRALGSTGEAGTLIRIVSAEATRDTVIDSLGIGARAVVREDVIEADIAAAVREVERGRFFLSPKLVPHVLERYRELCGEMRRIEGAVRDGASGLLRRL